MSGTASLYSNCNALSAGNENENVLPAMCFITECDVFGKHVLFVYSFENRSTLQKDIGEKGCNWLILHD